LQKKVEKALKFSNKDLDKIAIDIFSRETTGGSEIDIRGLRTINEELLNTLNNLGEPRRLLTQFKDSSLMIRVAKRFSWFLKDGELWNNLPTGEEDFQEKNFVPLFKDKSLFPLLILNPDIAKLIINDIKQNSEKWRQDFGITEDTLEEIEEIVEDFED